MRDDMYYYEFFKHSRGEYTVYESKKWHYELFNITDRVWRQGKKGGVKVINENWILDFKKLGKTRYGRKYMTRNEKAMQEFAWVKLKAQPVKYKEK